MATNPHGSPAVILFEADALFQDISAYAIESAGIGQNQLYKARSEKEVIEHLEQMHLIATEIQTPTVVIIILVDSNNMKCVDDTGGKTGCINCARRLLDMAEKGLVPKDIFVACSSMLVEGDFSRDPFDAHVPRPLVRQSMEDLVEWCNEKFPTRMQNGGMKEETSKPSKSTTANTTAPSSVAASPVAQGMNFILAHREPLCLEALSCHLLALGMDEDRAIKTSKLNGLVDAIHAIPIFDRGVDVVQAIVIFMQSMKWAEVVKDELTKRSDVPPVFLISTDSSEAHTEAFKAVFFGYAEIHSMKALQDQLDAVHAAIQS
eukprot:TRINITY_DN26607_c0_g1_i1.p1 TRINITY_DN26607_c0_g1~~TRINITY_DN26607_c0_g1_i1.p1  ORF type:complete len:319 (+),score=58.58 TRINITY_DN26607_c0_g1_i1:104-1060(+)